MEFFSRPDLWIAFLTLFALEIVLGVDNVVFISILSDKLPPQLRRRARIVGLSLAMIFRIARCSQPRGSWASLRRCSASDPGRLWR
jgi:predicted tellurium resistance membrane protein TerC